MNSGSSRFDLKKAHHVIVGNLQYLRVTGGTFGWALLYFFALLLWWKYEQPPDLSLLVTLATVGVLSLLFTIEYPLTWMRTRRKEFKQVMKAYHDYTDSLPADYRIGQPAKALWDALAQLGNGLDDPERQLASERQSNGRTEA
jgi:hypothetical protein